MKHSYSIAALLALLLGGCNSNATSEENQLEIYSESAFVHYEQNDLERAESQALKGLTIDSHHVPLNLMMGWIMLRRDRPETLARAELVFRRLAETEEDHRVFIGLATTLERLGSLSAEASAGIRDGSRTTEAEDPVTRAQELASNAWHMRVESLEFYGYALERRTKNLKALNGSMRVCAALELFDMSLVHCDTLVSTLVAETEFWTRLLQQEDLNPEDERNLRFQIADARELMVTASVFAADIEHSLERNPEALAHLNFALEINPELAVGYAMRAESQAANGNLEQALADINRFIALSDKPHKHPDIKRAFELSSSWNRELRRAGM